MFRLELPRFDGHPAVKQGEIRKLLVLQTLPVAIQLQRWKPTDELGGTFTLERILGTVPVEPDDTAKEDAAKMMVVQLWR